jgi:hypothetical protein
MLANVRVERDACIFERLPRAIQIVAQYKEFPSGTDADSLAKPSAGGIESGARLVTADFEAPPLRTRCFE